MMPNITRGAKMAGVVSYLFGPGKANEHTSPHVVASNNPMVLRAGRSGAVLEPHEAFDLADELDTARIVFGTRVTRTDKKELVSAQQRGFTGSAALAEAAHDENVWHCSLSLSPDESADIGGLSDEKWSTIAHEFMAEMGFDSDGDASARWVAVHHGATKDGGDHIHIVASRVRDDGSIVKLWFPEPGQKHNTGDERRAQRVAHDIEARHGLRVTAGRAAKYTSKGTAPAQDNIAERTGRREPAKATLARRVRATAYAAESETEFVRMARANGMLIRPRYAAGSRTEVVGYSVALPSSEYATKDGQPVWHGGGKLGTDLTLPRLREQWPAPDDAHRADAVSAWAHNQRDAIDPTDFGDPTPPPRTASAAASRRPRDTETQALTFDEAKDRLRHTVLTIAAREGTEPGFVGALVEHPDLVVRPRYAAGSTTEVTGYSVALKSSIYAGRDGNLVWHGAGKLDNRLTLPALRKMWPSEGYREMAAYSWERAARAAGAAPNATDRVAADAERTARAWRERVDGLTDTARGPRAWAAAASETAGVFAAWAERTEAHAPGELSAMADALAPVAGTQRSPRDPRPAPDTEPSVETARNPGDVARALRRVSAMMLAASHDDPRYAWMAMFAQLAATSRAISQAMERHGDHGRAQQIEAATTAAERSFAHVVRAADTDGLSVRIDSARAEHYRQSPRATTRTGATSTMSRPVTPDRDNGHGR